MTDYRNRITALEYVASKELTPHPGNWRNHGKAQTEALKGILSEVGISDALLAYHSERNGGKLTVIDGHLRKDAAPQTWPVLVLDVDDAEADYLLATHDPLAAMATADAAALDALLSSVNSGEAAVQAMLAELAKEAGLYGEPVGDDPGAQIDKAEGLRQKWGTESGQLWAIGEHRVICGDCTDGETVGRVAPNEQADLWLTDPPYGVSYADKNRFLNTISPGNRIQEPIANDHLSLDDAAALWKQAALIALGACADHASYYWFACQGGDQMMMMMMLHEAGWRVRHELIWVKNNHVLGRTDYNYKHEPILYGWKQDGKHRFWGGFQTSVLEFAKPQASDLHPTTKPTELIERLLVNSSQSGELVLDSFLGSGTTLIACERLGRRCRGIEISPAYIAVTLERWATMTGKTPELLP